MAEGVRETIGERVRRLRIAQGKSQEDIAGPGVSSAYISRIEVGARVPSSKAVRVLAERLGVRACYLETGTDLNEVETLELRLLAALLRLRLNREDAVWCDVIEALKEAETMAEADLVVEAEIGLGLAAADARDYEAAISFLRSAVDSGVLSPATDPLAYATLATSYGALGCTNGVAPLLGAAHDAAEILLRVDARERCRARREAVRLEEWASEAASDGRARSALRARRIALAVLNFRDSHAVQRRAADVHLSDLRGSREAARLALEQGAPE